MAGRARALTVTFVGDSSDLERDLKKVRKQLEWTQKDLQRLKSQARQTDDGLRAFSRSGSLVSRGLRDIGHGAAYALGAGGFGGGMYALFDITKKSIAEFKESERVTRQTAAALKSTGGAAGISAKGIGDLANALKKKTAIDDESIQAGENMLLTFRNIRNVVGKNNDIFTQATKATTDLATAFNSGATPSLDQLRTSAVKVGKALNDPIAGVNALSRVGVQFTQQQKDQIKTLVQSGHGLQAQKIILAELNKEFGGSAARQATAGKRLNVTMGDIAENIGRKLNPALKAGAGWLNNFIVGMQTGRGEGGRFSKTMRSVGESLAPYWRVVDKVAKVLAKGLLPALQIVSAPLKLQARLFYAIEKAVLSVYSAIANKVLWALQKMVEAIGGVAGVAKHLPLVGGAFKKVQSAAQAAADEIGSIRSAIDSLPTRKTVKINVIANDQGSLVGDNKPAGRGGASLPRSFTGKGARSIANEIIRTGRAAGASDKQILAALEAGIVESGLRNLSYGDRDSVGVFQQRPSQGWTGLMNVTKAAKEFFQHAKNADRGGLSAGQLAQAVQRSKYPGRYDQVRNKALGYLRGSGAGTTKQGTFNTGSTGGAGGKRNPKLEQMSLDSAINWLKKNFPGIGYLLEDKGGANQHLHINSTNHKQIRAIARALEEMGFDVGEYGGKPIPGVGGITTLKHKHYGAADHYHGGAIDINADNELVRAFGIAVKQKGSRRPQTFRAPVLGNKDFLDFIQGRIEHFDLMVRAGLMSATKAVLKKRDAIKSRLGLLTGDAKLEALAMLRELPVPKPQPKTFNIANQRNLAVAFAQKNPGFMPEGGWQRLGVDMTSNNPWLQAALTHTQSLVSAGHLSPAQGDALTKGYLQNALPFLQGDDKLAVESLLKQIATNTADTAHAVAQQAISDAGFFGSLTGPAADAVRGVLASNGIDVTPGGVSAQATIGNPQAASGLATSDIAELMSEVRSGAATFTDVWPQIMADLGVIAGATQETADNTQQQLDAIKEENRQLRQRLGVSQAQYAVLNGTRGMARNASRGLPGRGGGS